MLLAVVLNESGWEGIWIHVAIQSSCLCRAGFASIAVGLSKCMVCRLSFPAQIRRTRLLLDVMPTLPDFGAREQDEKRTSRVLVVAGAWVQGFGRLLPRAPVGVYRWVQLKTPFNTEP